MGEDRRDLILGIAVHEVVVEHDLLEFPEAGAEGVDPQATT